MAGLPMEVVRCAFPCSPDRWLHTPSNIRRSRRDVPSPTNTPFPRVSFFKKLFGAGKSPEPSAPTPADAAAASTPTDEPIKAYDKFGREILIPRHEWLDGVLLGQIRKEWDNPEELSAVISQSLRDGFFTEVEDAAKHLVAIDPDPARATTLLAVIHLQTGRPAEAERVLVACLKANGDSGIILTNLAKAQTALGRKDDADATLWRALENDPNQDNGLGWFMVLHREKGGRAAEQEALRRVAAIPRSWRARLWLARTALEDGDLEAALGLYHESLAMAPRPVPADLLSQMSGDLGNHGHIPEILNLAGPHFDVAVHGLTVGNNLIKACIDTGHLDAARDILRKLEACQYPAWRDTLGYWEGELQKSGLETEQMPSRDEIRLTMLQLQGPLWFIPDHATRRAVPERLPDSPHIVFLGSSFESESMGLEPSIQPSDGPGRISRALPLFLNETVHLHSDARTTTFMPWIANGGGGFGLFGSAWDPADLAQQAREMTAGKGGTPPADFLVGSHLVSTGENWKLKLDLVRTIDGRTVASFSHDFAEGAFHRIADQVTGELLAALSREAGTETRTPPAEFLIRGSELDHYLFRLEQTLAVRCGTIKGVPRGFLSNPGEILDGVVILGLQNPHHLPSRILLWRVLDGLKANEPELVQSMAEKVRGLQAECPLDPAEQESLDEEFRKILGG